MAMMFEEFESFDSSPPPRPAEATSPLVRLQYLIDNTPAIVYSSVPSGDFKLTFVSKNAYHVLGYPPEEMLADPNFWFDHLHPEDAPNIFSSLAQLFVEGERSYEYRFRTAGGDYLWMHDQLLQSEKMASIGQLAAGVAHEINNPLGFVNSNMGTLKKYINTLLAVVGANGRAVAQMAPGTPLAARVDAIGREADLAFLKEDVPDLVKESLEGLKRVREIVQALKDFSHVGETDWQPADLHAGLDSTLNIVANEIKYKATVEKRYGSLPEVTCLPSQLNQVFMNLLVNAAHAIEESGIITISTGVDGDWVWVAISDTGCGIPPQNLNRIFEPFFTTKPVGSGTGLGLSLSYSTVSKHGGRIDVDSRIGVGTTFTVRLPIEPPASAAGASEAAA